MDLYATLEVPREASKEEIQRAFRRLAKLHHPDKKGGDRDKFEQVRLAHDVLIDVERRRYYDETGKFTDEQKTVIETATRLFSGALDQCGIGQDALKITRTKIETEQSQFGDEILCATQVLTKLRVQRKRIVAKKGPNLLQEVIDRKIEQQERFIVDRKEAIELGTKMLAFLSGYEWEDMQSQQSKGRFPVLAGVFPA